MIRKVEEPAEVWRITGEMNERENLRERSSYYVLAQFIPGEVFHVDSIVSGGRVVFAGANRYGRPPLEVAHGGGAYVSRTVAHGSDRRKKLFALNRKLVKAAASSNAAPRTLSLLRATLTATFTFSRWPRASAALTSPDVLEAASGLNLWREWAQMEVGDGRRAGAGGSEQERSRRDGHNKLKPLRNEYAGIVLSLSKQGGS